MQFLVPAFLVGLAALAVPVLLHLRHRDRDTPHRFPSLMFLDRLPIRTADRRRVTDWPLLLLRALALLLLVLAFARPFIPARRGVAGGRTARTVVVLLDRSLSMSRRDVWSVATDSVRRIVNALSTADRAALVLFDDEADVVQPLTDDHATLLAALAKARPRAGGTRYAAGLRAARQVAGDGDGEPVEVIVVSDLQRTGASGVAGVALPPRFTVRTAVISRDRGNARVAVTEARRAEQGGRQMVSIVGHVESYDASAARRVSATLRLNGRPSGNIVVNVPAAGEVALPFAPVPLPTGLVRGDVTIDPDALAADDTAYFTLSGDDVLRVLLVSADDAAGESMYLERALAVAGTPLIRLRRIRAGDLGPSILDSTALVVLWDVPVPGGRIGDALTTWVRRGGGIAVIAGSRLSARASATSLLPASIVGRGDRTDDRGGSLGDVRLDHPLLAPFRDAPAALHAPRFLRYARLEPAAHADAVARFDDGSAAIVQRREGAGQVVMVAAPLDARAGDFPLQPAYLPFVRRLVVYTAGRDAVPLARVTGESWLLPDRVREAVVETPDGSIVRPMRDVGGSALPLHAAGFYALHDGSVRGLPISVVAANAPARESDLAPMTPQELLAGTTRDSVGAASGPTTGTPSPETAERRQGAWRLLLAALAVLLVAEMTMASRGWRGSAEARTLNLSERRDA